MKSTAKRTLNRQLERLPMDQELREDLRAGVERLSDAEAAEQARRLEAGLNGIPGLLDRLDDKRPERAREERTAARAVRGRHGRN